VALACTQTRGGGATFFIAAARAFTEATRDTVISRRFSGAQVFVGGCQGALCAGRPELAAEDITQESSWLSDLLCGGFHQCVSSVRRVGWKTGATRAIRFQRSYFMKFETNEIAVGIFHFRPALRRSQPP
jgi:hypothetical protein